MSRGRKPNVVRSSELHVSLPEDLRTRLDLLLFSELENRVPKGAYMHFFVARLIEFFEHRPLDLSPYLGTLPGERVVRGHPDTLAILQAKLEQVK